MSPLFAVEVNDDDDNCVTVEDDGTEASAVKVDDERIVDIVLGSAAEDDRDNDDVVDVTMTSRTPCTITVCVSCTVVSTVVDWSNDIVVVMLNYMEYVKVDTENGKITGNSYFI